MNLADPAFTDTQHSTNFLQVQFFLIVKAEHQLFSLGQVTNRSCQALPEVVRRQAIQRVITVLCFFYRQLAGFIELIQAKKSATVSIAQGGIVFVEVQPQLLGYFRVLSFPTQAVLDSLDGFGNAAGVPVDGSRYPVTFANFIYHGSANPDPGVCLKGSPLVGTVSLCSFQQANHACLHKVIQLDRCRQPRHEVKRYFFDQRGLLLNELGRSSCTRPVVGSKFFRQCHVSGYSVTGSKSDFDEPLHKEFQMSPGR